MKAALVYIKDTEPYLKDSDYSGKTDDKEDPDEDGLNNLEEFRLGTNPLMRDTDGDNLEDGYEINISKTNPLVKDSDSDGIEDADEIKLGTDPNNSDTNGNGIVDSEENFEQTFIINEKTDKQIEKTTTIYSKKDRKFKRSR